MNNKDLTSQELLSKGQDKLDNINANSASLDRVLSSAIEKAIANEDNDCACMILDIQSRVKKAQAEYRLAGCVALRIAKECQLKVRGGGC